MPAFARHARCNRERRCERRPSSRCWSPRPSPPWLHRERGAFGENEELAIATLVVAPSLGRWYVGEVGLVGMGGRAAGVALFASGILGDGDTDGRVGAGIALIAAATLYDVVGSGHAAYKQNERRWAAAPTVVASPSGAVAPGLALGGSF